MSLETLPVEPGGLDVGNAGFRVPYRGPGGLSREHLVAGLRIAENRDVLTGRPLDLAAGSFQFHQAMRGALALDYGTGINSEAFPLYQADQIRRQVWEHLKSAPDPLEPFFKKGPSDVLAPLTSKIYEVTGAEQPIPVVGEGAAYTSREISEALLHEVTVRKYGTSWGWTFEAQVNGARNYLDSMPGRVAEAWKNTKAIRRLEVFATTTGWKTTTSQNPIPTTPLSFDSLAAAYATMKSKVTNSVDGYPAPVMPTHLMVPVGLELEARRILGSAQILSPSATTMYGTDNPLRPALAGLQIVVNPWIPTVVTAGTANTMWGLFALGGSNRPVAWEGFLRGYENPEIAVKTTGRPDNMSLENDAVWFRFRAFLGLQVLDSNFMHLDNGA